MSDIPPLAPFGGGGNNGAGVGGGGGREFCQPARARNINWSWTRRGEVAIVPCPHGATGKGEKNGFVLCA